MKIKRFFAPDMRTAFRLVREEQGPNAVILSSRRTDDGVEVVAATDYDEALVQQAVRATRRTPAQAAAPEGAPPLPPPQAAASAEPKLRPQPLPEPIAEDPNLDEMRRELSGMRALLEREIARHAHERLRVSPLKAQVLEDLEEFGCEPETARAIAACMNDGIEPRKARGHALGLWAKSIPAVRGDVTAAGGMFALVGPTGVGKTTTIAKLAARFARRNGPRDIALVTTDTYRIGAREQLYTYGRLIGVPVFEAGSREALAQTLARLADYRLVLVDTAGMSQRDRSLAQQLAWIEAVPNLRPLLCLPANAQPIDLDEVVRRFWSVRPEAVVLTKLDETGRLGASLSVAMRHQLPVAYVTDGQRVPEDLHLAEPHRLVLRAAELRAASRREGPAAESAHAAA
jgi:flagellar biosynthesis protein FlhF